MRINYWMVVIFLITNTINSQACRFTIREIGYSQLNLGYYILHLEADTLLNSKLVNEFTNIAYANSIDTNLKYRVSHKSGQEPVLNYLNSVGERIDQEQIRSSAGINSSIRNFLISPLRQSMGKQMGNAFAFVVCFFGENHSALNNVVDEALTQFCKISPNLDKEVKEEIVVLKIPFDQRRKEDFVLKAIGVPPEEKKPVVVVFYGRARVAGKLMIGDQITADHLFRQLVTLGTDCECGIDLSPLLKHAIPFVWEDEIRQDVSDMLGFDVDNPLILSEMGRILSKEKVNAVEGDLSFAPQTIDLDREFEKQKRLTNQTPSQELNKAHSYRYLIIIISIFIFLVIGTGLLLLKRK